MSDNESGHSGGTAPGAYFEAADRENATYTIIQNFLGTGLGRFWIVHLFNSSDASFVTCVREFDCTLGLRLQVHPWLMVILICTILCLGIGLVSIRIVLLICPFGRSCRRQKTLRVVGNVRHCASLIPPVKMDFRLAFFFLFLLAGAEAFDGNSVGRARRTQNKTDQTDHECSAEHLGPKGHCNPFQSKLNSTLGWRPDEWTLQDRNQNMNENDQGEIGLTAHRCVPPCGVSGLLGFS